MMSAYGLILQTCSSINLELLMLHIGTVS